MRVAFASPTYGPVQPEAVKAIRRAVMVAARSGHDFIDDVSYNRETIVHTRNFSLRAALNLNVDGVLWCDSDMVPGSTNFANLLGNAEDEYLDILAGLAFTRRSPYTPCAWWENPFTPITDIEQGITEVDGVGFGCVYTSLQVLAEVGKFSHPDDTTEDRHFCATAKQLGYKIYVDTHVRVPHIAGPRIIDERAWLLEQGLHQASPTLPPDGVYSAA